MLAETRNWKIWAIPLLVIFCIILWCVIWCLPGIYTSSIMSYYEGNSSLATIHTNMGTCLFTAFITFLYVLLTAALVIQSKKSITASNKAIDQSKESITASNKAIDQSKTEHEVMYIQSRLEKLYYPLKNMLDNYQINVQNIRDADFISKFQVSMHKIIPYSYLASDGLSPCLNSFINIFNKNGTLIKEAEKEKLDKMKQGETQSEEMVEAIAQNQKLIEITPSRAWEILKETDIVEAVELYIKILNKINCDIEYYRNRLNDLTDSSRIED